MFGDLIDGNNSNLDVIEIGFHVCSGRKLYLVTRGSPNSGINTNKRKSTINDGFWFLLMSFLVEESLELY